MRLPWKGQQGGQLSERVRDVERPPPARVRASEKKPSNNLNPAAAKRARLLVIPARWDILLSIPKQMTGLTHIHTHGSAAHPETALATVRSTGG